MGDEPAAETFGRAAIAERGLEELHHGNFVRYGLTQVTHGSIGDDLARRMIERIPEEIAKGTWKMMASEQERFGETIRELNVPLLFAKHDGCLHATEKGFRDAVAAFPEARTVSCPGGPSVSSEFAVALRSFVTQLGEDPRDRQASPSKQTLG